MHFGLFFPPIFLDGMVDTINIRFRMIICKSPQNSHMYKCCLTILKYFVETTKIVEIGQWCINWINQYHHSPKEKTKQLQHIQSSWTLREWSCIKPRLGSCSWVGDVVKTLLHNSQILKFLFINMIEGGHFHLLACFYLLCLFLTNRKWNCFTGLWNQIFEAISEFYLMVRLKMTCKFQRHRVEKGNFFFF